MKLTWIDERSSLLIGKNQYTAGDEIPAKILAKKRLDSLVSQGKIRIGDLAPAPGKRDSEIYGIGVEATVITEDMKKKPEPVKAVEPIEEPEEPDEDAVPEEEPKEIDESEEADDDEGTEE